MDGIVPVWFWRGGGIAVDILLAGLSIVFLVVTVTLLPYSHHAGKVLTHRHLLREIWGPNAVEHVHYLRVHMASPRRKIEANPARPAWLMTEAGVGYRLRDAPP